MNENGWKLIKSNDIGKIDEHIQNTSQKSLRSIKNANRFRQNAVEMNSIEAWNVKISAEHNGKLLPTECCQWVRHDLNWWHLNI